MTFLQAVHRIWSDSVAVLEESAESYAEKLFNTVDKNGDGEITFDEFVKASEDDDSLINLLLPSPE